MGAGGGVGRREKKGREEGEEGAGGDSKISKIY